MASVNEILNRLAREDPLYGTYRPGLGTSRTERMEAVTDRKDVPLKSWVPNRKVVSGAVAGVVSWVALMVYGHELDADTTAAIVGVVMTAVSYLVPLPKQQDPAGRY